jgi:PKHD-type hydroxylase
MGWNFNVDGINQFMEYNTYTDNSGHYLWYSDIVNSNTNKLSVTLHLSLKEEYNGGDTEFNCGYEILRPKFSVGDVVIFPSYLLQRTTPILSGVKRTITLNVTGKTFR